MTSKISDLSEDDKLHKALGKFTISFSKFQAASELMIVKWLCPSGEREDRDRTETWIVNSGQTIQHMVDSIFPLCIRVMKEKWSEDDFSILRSINKEMNLIISERNYFVEGYMSFNRRNSLLFEESDVERECSHAQFQRPLEISVREMITEESVNLLIEKTNRLVEVVRKLGLMGFPTYRTKPSELFEVHSDYSVHMRGR